MEPKGHRVRLSFDLVGSQDTDVNGEKHPVILLHGVTSAKEIWKNVMHPIAKATGRMVYAYDARNHGDNGWSDEFDYDVMLEDLLQFMDYLQMQKAVLIGHSLGAKTAMFFSAKWPKRVEKFIIEDTSPSSETEGFAKQYVLMLGKITDRIPESVTELEDAKNFLHKLFLEDIPEEHRSSRHGTTDGSILPLIKDENGKYKWKTNLEAIINTMFHQSYIPPPVCGTYHGPALFLHGTKSPHKITNDREYILNHFPGARFRAVEGATHQIHREFADDFVREVGQFLNESK